MRCGIGLARPRARVNKLCLLAILAFFTACKTGTRDPEPFDWQGHRGARGEAPENSVQGMLLALQEGVKTLEMDVVISADSVVLLSHEPWFNPEICLGTNGKKRLNAETNLFRLSYADIAKIDCGSLKIDRFPAQEKYFAAKPRLLDVISEAEEASLMMNRPDPFYNVEIKSRPEWDSIYYPSIEFYADLVISTLRKANLGERLVIQSFDPRTLRYLNESYPEITLAYLTEDGNRSPAEQIKDLGFVPEIYSCDFSLLAESQVKRLRASGMKVIPWTVNEIADAQRLKEWGVDGIITDYPGRMLATIGKF